MRILLAQRLPYFHAFIGETRSNRVLLESLAERNHACRIVSLATSDEGPNALGQLRNTLANQGTPLIRSLPNADVYAHRGVEVHVAADGSRLWTHLAEQIHEFDPSCVLISQDRTFLGLAAALADAGTARVVFLAHSQATLPFGPECFSPDEAKTEVLRRTRHIVAPSHYIADYIHRWSGLAAHVIPYSTYGTGPFPKLGRPDTGFVTLVNPSQLKGISIFEELARARPDIEFAAVPTWSTTNEDLARLRTLQNVRLLPPSEQIDDVLAHTRILIVPSLWGEGFGLIVVEAMLRGIPVLASNIGGLPEAKLGIDYLLPVQPIKDYRAQVDDRGLPVPVVPRQDIDPWLAALDRLMTDPVHYNALSEASRTTALGHVSTLTVAPLEKLLERVSADYADTARRGESPVRRPPVPGLDASRVTTGLSRDRLALLASLLKHSE